MYQSVGRAPPGADARVGVLRVRGGAADRLRRRAADGAPFGRLARREEVALTGVTVDQVTEVDEQG